MAAAAAPQPAVIDLKAKASFAVRLGSSLLQSSKTRTFTSIRYNHKPDVKAQDEVHYTLRTTGEDEETLLLQDGKSRYQYDGKAARQGAWFILMKKEGSSDDATTLERVEFCHDFNLVKTPSEKDSAKLAAHFEQLPIHADDAVFGEVDDAPEPLDSRNPWDYRNYLKQSNLEPKSHGSTKPKPTPSNNQSLSRPTSSTPTSRPVKPAPSPLLTQTKRKAPSSAKPNAKRVKAGTEELKPAAQSSQDVPEVRIDRKASIRRSSIDDSGELILENETPVTEKPPRRAGAMALALAGQLGGGPISLRSAASSPASRMASPMPPRPEGMDESGEFDLGESSPKVEYKQPTKQREGDYFGGDNDDADAEDADVDADADVEDLELPSPAQTHRKSVSAATVTGLVDDDDDLDKQLQAAMMEDDDGGVEPAPHVQSDEESEEE